MLLILQLFLVPQAMSTWRGGSVRLRWRKRMGAGVSSIWTSTQNIRVILSSYHAKKLAVYFISKVRGRPQGGRGSMDNHSITKFATVVPYTYEYVSKFWQENDHTCRS